MDLIGLRQHYLPKIANRPLAVTGDQQALQALLIDEVRAERLDLEEAKSLAETFDFELNHLGYGLRDLLVSVSSHYSLGAKHPMLVRNLFRFATDPTYPGELLGRGYDLPVHAR